MRRKRGTLCPIKHRVLSVLVGSKMCLECLFNNDTYDCGPDEIVCVFPKEEE